MSDHGAPLVEVRNLIKHYPITQGVLKREVGRVKAVDGIDFAVHRGETVGLVGESGCGKSTAATTLLQLEEPTDGQVIFDGDDITEFDQQERKRFRRRAQMIFQNPDSSFDPRMSVGESVAEPLRIHGMNDRKRRRRIVENLLERVGLAADDADRYPHEFSGGQKQRIALARALVVNPKLIVADEPVSALDVSIQAEILSLMESIQEEFGLSILLISHNMGVVREVCDRVAVMYLGEIVETAPTERLFENPSHPYTQALLSSILEPDPRRRGKGVELTGDVPSPSNPPSGCRFHTRCPKVIQPEDYEFEQSAWRAVMDLRERLGSGGIDREALRELVVANGDAPSVEAVTDEQLRTTIRRQFDVPATLTSADAEATLSDALDRIVDGDDRGAMELLAEEFATVCESTPPAMEPTDYDLSPANWEGVRQLRAATAGRLPMDAVREAAVERGVADAEGAVGPAELRETLRAQAGLDDQLADPDAERAVRDALDALVDERYDEALGRLSGTFGEIHAAACHLEDASVGAAGTSQASRSSADD